MKKLLFKLRRLLLVVIFLIALYAGFGFWAVPYFIKNNAPLLIQEQTGRAAIINEADFNPFTLNLDLRGFKLLEKNGNDFINADNLFVNFAVKQSIRERLLTIHELRLVGSNIRLQKLKNGTFNFSDLQTEDSEESDTPLFPLQVNHILIEKGKIDWEDNSQEHLAQLSMDEIALKLTKLSTLKNSKADLHLSMTLNKEGRFDWSGKLGINPIFSKGRFNLENIKADDLWKLALQNQVKFRLYEGRKSLTMDYDLGFNGNQLQYHLKNGRLQIQQLKFADKKQPVKKAVVGLPDFLLTGIDFDYQAQHLKIENFNIKKAWFDLIFDKQGNLNLQSVLAAETTDNNSQANTSTAKQPQNSQTSEDLRPWKVNVKKVAFTDLKLNIDDNSRKQPLLIQLPSFDLGVNQFSFIYTNEKLKMLIPDSSIKARNFSLKIKHQPSLISIPTLAVNGLKLDLEKQQINVARIQSGSGQLKAWLNKDGGLNYQSLFDTYENTAHKKTAVKKTENPQKNKQDNDWQVTVKQLDLTDYSLDFQDNTREKTPKTNLDKIKINLSEFSNKEKNHLPFKISSRINKQGQLNLNGSMVLSPFKTEMQLMADEIAIKPFQVYIEPFAKLYLLDGKLSGKGELKIDTSDVEKMQLSFKGNTQLNDFHTRDTFLKRDFVKWQNLTLNDIDFNLSPSRFIVSKIKLRSPYARVTVKKDKTLNIDDIFSIKRTKEKDNAKQTSNKKTKDTAFYYQINQVNIQKGVSDFSDLSLLMPFSVHLTGLNGNINKISSKQKTQTDVSLSGTVFDISPVNIKGSFSSDFNKLDLGLHFKNMPLPFISPYMVEFAGYKIEKGKLSLDLLYNIDNRKLTAENKLLIEQLTLGEEVENPKAASLPLDLAIALMEDSDGKIKIDMPLTGSLDDPEFEVMPLLFQAFANVITKAASSPFTAIASLINSEEDLSVIQFNAGESKLNEVEIKKLDDIAKALQERSELQLEIKGAAYTEQDWPAMQQQALLEQLKQMQTNKAKSSKKASEIELSKEEYQELLAELFIEKFPELAEYSFLGTPQLIDPEMGDFYQLAKEKLAAIIAADKQKLTMLAADRAQNITKYLIRTIDKSRIFILDAELMDSAEDDVIQVNLSLKTE